MILLDKGTTTSHDTIFKKFLNLGIGVNVHYIPIFMQPYYQNMGFKLDDYPNAGAYYQRAISLPIYPTLLNDEQDRVINAVSDLSKL